MVALGTASIGAQEAPLSGYLAYFPFRGSSSLALFRSQPSFPLDGEPATDQTVPTFVDLDGDGDQDVMAGNTMGHLFYYTNVGNATRPVYKYREDPIGYPWQAYWDGSGVGRDLAPHFADMDGDGDYDLWLGTNQGILGIYENKGTRYRARWGPPPSMMCCWKSQRTCCDYAAYLLRGVGTSDGQFAMRGRRRSTSCR